MNKIKNNIFTIYLTIIVNFFIVCYNQLYCQQKDDINIGLSKL